MSTILKALRRLEEESAEQQATSLEERIATPADAVAASRRGGLVLGLVGGGSAALVLAGIAFFFALTRFIVFT